MTVFVLSYDLHQPGRDYPKLWSELVRVGGIGILRSVWLVDVAQTAPQVRAAVESWMDANDSVGVFEIGGRGDWAVANVTQSAIGWLRRNAP